MEKPDIKDSQVSSRVPTFPRHSLRPGKRDFPEWLATAPSSSCRPSPSSVRLIQELTRGMEGNGRQSAMYSGQAGRV